MSWIALRRFVLRGSGSRFGRGLLAHSAATVSQRRVRKSKYSWHLYQDRNHLLGIDLLHVTLRNRTHRLVVAALAEHLEPLQTPDEQVPVRNAQRYLGNRLESLDYPLALKLGLPIGSGMIESGHRHVLHGRLKKAGAAWLHQHADQIAHLRVLRANQQWETFWN